MPTGRRRRHWSAKSLTPRFGAAPRRCAMVGMVCRIVLKNDEIMQKTTGCRVECGGFLAVERAGRPCSGDRDRACVGVPPRFRLSEPLGGACIEPTAGMMKGTHALGHQTPHEVGHIARGAVEGAA